MKIGIITLALLDNYGGILQNYALQQVLKKMGHEPCTIDYVPLTNFYREFPRVFGSWLKTIYLRVFKGVRRPFAKFLQPKKRPELFNNFISKNIQITEQLTKYTQDILEKGKYDTIIVGSDQVWRSKYSMCIEDYYLNFARDYSSKKIAYASSFGVDEWEYSNKQTLFFAYLAKKFDSISVRENSGVLLCKEHLGVDASWVLDPTLLLKKSDYLKICEDVPQSHENYLAAYILDETDGVSEIYKKIAKEENLTIKFFAADFRASLSVEEWLAMFRDAAYIVTDSFHGTVFSIIFEKKFKCLFNEERGSARFKSLLSMYNSRKLDEMRQFSLNWLKNALES